MKKYFAKLVDGKMMLCSRDIQVGEIATIIESDGVYGDFTVKTTTPQLREKLNFVGEISPEATWVKEGDWFDDYHDATFYETEYGWSREQPWCDIIQQKKFCTVKGPCGHFH